MISFPLFILVHHHCSQIQLLYCPLSIPFTIARFSPFTMQLSNDLSFIANLQEVICLLCYTAQQLGHNLFDHDTFWLAPTNYQHYFHWFASTVRNISYFIQISLADNSSLLSFTVYFLWLINWVMSSIPDYLCYFFR